MSEYDDDYMLGHLESQYSSDLNMQTPEAGSQLEPEDNVPTGKKVRQKNYSHKEDQMLVAAWLNVGFDAVVGSDQLKPQLWRRILEFYEENLEKGKGYPTRHKEGLENRWTIIKKDCKKFRGCLTNAEKHRESGNTNSNTFEVAKTLFHDRGGKEFIFSHCWDLLKDNHIWAKVSSRVPSYPGNTNSSSASPRVVNLAEGVEEVPDSVGQSLPRPLGKRSELKRRRVEQLKEQRNVVVEQAFGSWNDSENKRRLEEQRISMESIQVEKERMEREDLARVATLALEKERMKMEASAKEEALKIEREKMLRDTQTRAVELRLEKDRMLQEKERMKQDRVDKERDRKEQQKKSDMEIMNKDLGGLSEVQRDFFKMCQAEVFARWKKEATSEDK